MTAALVATATLLYIVVLYGTLSVLHTGFEFTDAETNRHAVVLLAPAGAGRSAEVVGHGLAAIAEIAFAKRFGDIGRQGEPLIHKRLVQREVVPLVSGILALQGRLRGLHVVRRAEYPGLGKSLLQTGVDIGSPAMVAQRLAVAHVTIAHAAIEGNTGIGNGCPVGVRHQTGILDVPYVGIR